MCPNMNSPAFEPTDEQKAIIKTNEDTIVVSNPGTGKTFTLALKVMELLQSKVEPEDILCITFTEKAQKEMFEKISSLAKERKIPISKILKIKIHTFHSFALRYLKEVGLISGNIIGNNFLRFSILESFVANQALNYGKGYIISDIVPKVENATRYMKNFGVTPDKIDLDDAEEELKKLHDEDRSSITMDEMKAFLRYFVEAYKHYEDSKTRNADIDFADLLLMFVEKFRGAKIPYVLVDEMQDMNKTEAEMVKSIVGKRLFLVGDAKQAIFGFQGGSIKNFQDFTQTCKRLFLSENWRSTNEILDYSKNYFLSSTGHKANYEEELKKFSSARKGSIPKVFSTVGHLSKILCLIKENKGKEIGIITRTNKQIIEISKHLDINNIEYTATSSQATSLDARSSTITFIKALISNDSADKVSATFTAFSPYSLREAFDFSTALEKKDYKQIAKINLGTADLTRDSLDRLFLEKIYPLCVSKGPEWFTTAVSIRSQIDEYLTVSNPTLEALLDFLAIGEEVEVERSKKAEITLSTVHKAKGREFDIVIALPSSSVHPYSYIDTIVSSIFKSKGIDLQDEIIEESIRVNFVAFTRAKKELNIITDLTHVDDFHWDENLSDLEVDAVTDTNISSVLDYNLTEAYSLFLGGKFTQAEKLLKGEDPWLMERIVSYFNNVDHFSWSSVMIHTDEFLMKNILGVKSYSRKFGGGSGDGTKFGLEVHPAFKKILDNKAKPEDFSGDVKRALKNGLSALKDLENDYPGLKLVGTEVDVTLPLKSVVKYKHDDLLFKGTIDALYKHDSGYLEVDWKSSKKDSDVSVHKRQLSVYKTMYSIHKKIPVDEITTCVIFVALRGGINTGRFGRSTHIGKRDAQVFKTFEGHLQKVLEWRKDPKKFIKGFLELQEKHPLILILQDKLKKELRHRKTKPKKPKSKKS